MHEAPGFVMDKTISIIFGLLIFLGGSTAFIAVLNRAFWSYDNPLEVTGDSRSGTSTGGVTGTTSPIASPALGRELPRRLIIPALQINAAVQHVGIARSGNMAVPTNYVDVGWYRYGPTPGEKGSAVIDGHVDNGFSIAGVFKRLPELRIGDEIQVTTETGALRRFRVVSVVVYDLAAVPREEVFSTEGPPRLVLITCNGAWLPNEKTYDKRIVITAVYPPPVQSSLG